MRCKRPRLWLFLLAYRLTNRARYFRLGGQSAKSESKPFIVTCPLTLTEALDRKFRGFVGGEAPYVVFFLLLFLDESRKSKPRRQANRLYAR